MSAFDLYHRLLGYSFSGTLGTPTTARSNAAPTHVHSPAAEEGIGRRRVQSPHPAQQVVDVRRDLRRWPASERARSNR